jgi:hypothetical protein
MIKSHQELLKKRFLSIMKTNDDFKISLKWVVFFWIKRDILKKLNYDWYDQD